MSAEQSAAPPSGLTWFRSSYSGPEGGECIEVAIAADAVHLRDSKDRPGPQLGFDAVAWVDFLRFTIDR